MRVLRALLLFGSAALGLIWALETRTGVITPWDRGLYPLLIGIFVACATLLYLRPDRPSVPKVVANVATIVYLVLSMQLIVFTGDGPIDMFRLSTVMLWMPLCYSAAFVFLELRQALLASAATFACILLPIVAALVLGAPPRWGTDFPILVTNLALAQLTYIVMLVAISRMRAEFVRSQERVGLMRTLAVTDVLTGLPNRRALTDALVSHLALAQRGTQALSVILIDVDHFKQINDQHGHAAGDATLIQLGSLLQAQVRGSDRVGRWGGEEFLVIAPATTLAAVNDVAERIRETVAGWAFPHGDPVTVSLGLTQVLPGDGIDTLLQRADRALYRAKRRGRNCVEHQAVAVAS